MRTRVHSNNILSWINTFWMDYASGLCGADIARLQYRPFTQEYRITWGNDIYYEGPDVEKAVSIYNSLGETTWTGEFLVRIRIKGTDRYVANKNAFIDTQDEKRISPHILTYGFGGADIAKVWTDVRQLRRDIAVNKCIKRGETWSKLEAVWPDGSTSPVMEAARENETP